MPGCRSQPHRCRKPCPRRWPLSQRSTGPDHGKARLWCLCISGSASYKFVCMPKRDTRNQLRQSEGDGKIVKSNREKSENRERERERGGEVVAGSCVAWQSRETDMPLPQLKRLTGILNIQARQHLSTFVFIKGHVVSQDSAKLPGSASAHSRTRSV